MTWRLLVLGLLGSGPSATLTPWTTTGGVDVQELRFTDPAGAHVVRFTRAKEQVKTRGDVVSRSRELTITHLVGTREVFRARDFVQACEFDLALEVVEGTVQVTDLDGDGEAEVSFLYRLGCRSDVSPLTAKLLLYEGATKYALRGETREQVGADEYVGGDFKADPAFERAPRAFLEFARTQWKRAIFPAP